MQSISDDHNFYAVLGPTNRIGIPHLAPMWFTWEDGAAYMITGRTSAKWRNIHSY